MHDPLRAGWNDLEIPVLTPLGRDAELVCSILERDGLACRRCATVAELLELITGDCGPVVVAEEALPPGYPERMLVRMEAQPRWSELPLIIFMGRSSDAARFRGLTRRRSVTVVRRPVATPTFLALVRAAVEARRRQYEVRDLLRELTVLNQRLGERADQLRDLALELTEAEHRERQRLSQVLHDHLQQVLVGAKYQIGLIPGRGAKEAAVLVARVERLLTDAVEISRSLAVELSPPVLHDSPLPEALLWLGRRMARDQHLEVEMQLEDDLPPLVESVKLLLFETARELLFNVSKHAGVKNARLQLRRDGEVLSLAVVDEGRGIPPPNGSARNAPGMGLLRLRERLEYAGGSVAVVSHPGGGTRAEVRLALEPALEQADDAAAPAAPRRRSAVARGRRRDDIRVLLADDHAVVREGLKALLEMEPDIEVVGEADDGLAAVALSASLAPDVIVMDISMPEMDGIAATREISRQADPPRIVALSMHRQTDMAERMLAAGAQAYLAKDGPMDRLPELIRRLVRRSVL
ncbi:MAG: response regulator [Candidatus Krumholzibacteriia bacterium]